MTTDVHRPRWQIPPLNRDERILGGACHAIATELGVGPLAIRLSFVILVLAGGWGLVLYGLTWAFLSWAGPSGAEAAAYVPEPKGASVQHRYAALGLIVGGLILSLRTLGFGFVDQIVFPVGFILAGVLIAWNRQQTEGGVTAAVRISAGVLVAAGGIIAVAALNVNSWEALRLLAIMIVVLLGLSLIVGPSVARIGTELDEERQERVRADERARVAAHLHDSVLQTLTLIQKHSEDPKRMAQLARRQERELRTWLYEPTPEQPGTIRLGPALDEVADAVEHDHQVRVEVVTVGDSLDLRPESIDDLVSATREAVTNAAKHAEIDRIDVYAEHRPNAIEVFIRDAGIGFDPDDVAADRHGIRQSIKARLERHGGRATIFSEPGQGTEVELYLPLNETTTRPAIADEPQPEPENQEDHMDPETLMTAGGEHP
ncbi:MAG: ATP-binding protein [Acidimicrobiia bacterium]|nr:ATP-binding protein [Acidimicrobiia bacterium]